MRSWWIASLVLALTVTAAGKPCGKTDFKSCEKQCANKQGPSCLRLGMLYLGMENGAPAEDDTKARKAFEDACNYKTGEACVYAGDYAKVGKGGRPASAQEAHGWWEKGCRLNHGGSCLKLASALYDSGDKVKAAKYYEPACKHGEPSACGALGLMELKGDGIPAAPERGVRRFEVLCEHGIGKGCVEAGIAYERGEVGGREDMARARLLYEKGCKAAKPDDRGCTYAKK
jgi:TPR repeat protein